MSLPASRLRRKAPVNYKAHEKDQLEGDLDVESKVGASIDDSPDQAPNEEHFPLLNLPQELRDMIYKEAVIDPNGVFLKADFIVHRVHDRVVRFNPGANVYHHRTITERSKFSPSTNLLATCKQVYNEAIRYVYRQPFTFANPEAVHIFLFNMRPRTIRLLKDIQIIDIRCKRINNTALLSRLHHATGLTALRLADRLTVSDVHLRYSEKRIGSEIASRFYSDAAYFIRNFITVRGVDALLQVVKFHQGDLRGNQATRLQHKWNKARKDAIMEGIKARLLRNLRVRADGRAEIS